MNTKKVVLFAGLLGTVFLFVGFSLGSDFCSHNNFCIKIYNLINNDFVNNDMFQLIFLTPPLFFLSLLTYRLKDEVFRAWWNFARWFVPVIIVATFLLENAGSGGGSLGLDSAFTMLVLGVLYAVLVVVSLILIVRALPDTWGKKD